MFTWLKRLLSQVGYDYRRHPSIDRVRVETGDRPSIEPAPIFQQGASPAAASAAPEEEEAPDIDSFRKEILGEKYKYSLPFLEGMGDDDITKHPNDQQALEERVREISEGARVSDKESELVTEYLSQGLLLLGEALLEYVRAYAVLHPELNQVNQYEK